MTHAEECPICKGRRLEEAKEKAAYWATKVAIASEEAAYWATVVEQLEQEAQNEPR